MKKEAEFNPHTPTAAPSGYVSLCSASELNLEKTFECGQCFRWEADESGVYMGIAGGFPAELLEAEGEVLIRSNAPAGFWEEYFDLETDYAAASEPFYSVPYLSECTEDGFGIRILRQEFWEALCSFIISQCNNIKRIKGIVSRLCEECGEEVEFNGRIYREFPSAERISAMKVEDLSFLRAGYRAPYIISAARAVAAGELEAEELRECGFEEAKKELLKLEGVGEKVANCVVLFGLHHMEAFPVDVWIKRALKEHFPPDFEPGSLGPYAGLAQQYIFYHMRG